MFITLFMHDSIPIYKHFKCSFRICNILIFVNPITYISHNLYYHIVEITK